MVCVVTTCVADGYGVFVSSMAQKSATQETLSSVCMICFNHREETINERERGEGKEYVWFVRARGQLPQRRVPLRASVLKTRHHDICQR